MLSPFLLFWFITETFSQNFSSFQPNLGYFMVTRKSEPSSPGGASTWSSWAQQSQHPAQQQHPAQHLSGRWIRITSCKNKSAVLFTIITCKSTNSKTKPFIVNHLVSVVHHMNSKLSLTLTANAHAGVSFFHGVIDLLAHAVLNHILVVCLPACESLQ